MLFSYSCSLNGKTTDCESREMVAGFEHPPRQQRFAQMMEW